MTALCFLDTETTGIHPKREVWEVGMIRRDAAGQREASFFLDVRLDRADPFGLAVGRYFARHPEGRMIAGLDTYDKTAVSHQTRSQWTAAQEIAVYTHGAHIVGLVPNFDAESLARLLRRCGFIPTWHHHLIDAATLGLGYLAHQLAASTAVYEDGWADPLALPWRSEDLSRALGVDPPTPDERHTALGDARWAMRLFDAVMPITKEPQS